VNDGSKDNSLKILKEYAKQDKRFKVFTKKNSGPALTRNVAISKSVGKYLMFCDADDWYEPDMIEIMYKTIMKNKVDIVSCAADIRSLLKFNANKKNKNFFIDSGFLISNVSSVHLCGKHNIKIDNIFNLSFVLWNKIIKKSLLEKYNLEYPKKYEHDDTVFLFKLLAVAKTYYGIKNELYHYVMGNKNSIMWNFYNKTIFENYFDFIWAYEDLFKFISKLNREDIEIFYCRFIFKKFKHYALISPAKVRKKIFAEMEKFSDLMHKKYKIKYLKSFYGLYNKNLQDIIFE
jgi:glycosyltransferase involved in cell wall biosynthesis